MAPLPKPGKDKGKQPTQMKLSDFGKTDLKLDKEASASNAGTASISSNNEAMLEPLAATPESCSELMLVKEEILKAVGDLRTEFTGKLNGILKAAEETKKQLSDCANRIGQAETRISNVEDDYCTLNAKMEELEKRNTAMEIKLVNMETRSRLNNVRLVNLPEGAENPDCCAFLESWLPDALDLQLRTPIAIERAHRVGPRRGTGDPPRPLIMKFMDYRKKVLVMEAAKTKKDVLYKNIHVRLYPDLATEVHKQRKQFDAVRRELRELGLRHGIRPPATMLVTYKGETLTFAQSSDVEELIRRVKRERSSDQDV